MTSRIGVVHPPNALVLLVHGSLSIEQTGDFQRSFEEGWRRKPARVVVDLSDCSYADSAGIAAVVRAFRRVQEAGARFYLVGLNDQVRSLLRVVRLDQVFETRPSVEEALKD